MNYYESLEKVILSKNPKDKIDLFEQFYKNFKEKNYILKIHMYHMT